jgi:predicted phosphodiesterase
MTTRLFLFSDIHANLPAMQAIEQAVADEAPDRVIFLGDMVDMGPHPAEVVDLIMAHADWDLLRGNHEGYMNGDVRSRTGIDGEELSHQAWTRKQLRADQIQAIQTRCLWQIDETIEGVPMRFQHYARLQPPDDDRFAANLRPKPHELEEIFQPGDRKLIAFGHLHYPHQGETNGSTYLSVGAAGPSKTANQAQYVIVEAGNGQCRIQQKIRTYDDRLFFVDMKRRKVASRQTILKIFYGGRS